MASEHGFESRINRFGDGLVVLGAIAGYNPSNPLITIANLTPLVHLIETKNLNVSNKETIDTDFRKERKQIAFKIKVENPDCIVARIDGMINYISGDLPAQKGALKQLTAIRKKIKPGYDKKPPNTPRGEGKSPSERSFASLHGNAKIVVGIITAIGIAYKPQNSKLTVANFTTVVDQLETLNKNIAGAKQNLTDAQVEREFLYDGKDGLDDRIALIKKYLAGFPGEKNSQEYKNFVRALKGS